MSTTFGLQARQVIMVDGSGGWMMVSYCYDDVLGPDEGHNYINTGFIRTGIRGGDVPTINHHSHLI